VAGAYIISSSTHLPVGRRFKNQRHPPTSTSRTHEPRLQAREREVGSARRDQLLQIELLPTDAASHGPRALAIAVGAPHVHPPAEASRHPECFDFHENKGGTIGLTRQASWRSGPLRVTVSEHASQSATKIKHNICASSGYTMA
jgi:hypothetical protein